MTNNQKSLKEMRSLKELTEQAVKPIEENKQPSFFETSLIKHEEAGEVIYQRIQDGYVNATAMCKSCGKLFGHYHSAKATQEFLSEFSSDIGIPISELVQIIKGGDSSAAVQDTWVHPQIAIHLGQWLSPKFAVQVSKWVFEWLNGKTPQQELPYHLRRYMNNMRKIPADHFSVLQEMTLVLIAPLEQQGYHLPTKMVPDISQGLIFAKWLRDQGVDTNSMPTYIHEYEDGRKVEAKMYPAKYLNAFREHVSKIWLPERAGKYFAERDERAIPYLNNILGIEAPKRRDKIADFSESEKENMKIIDSIKAENPSLDNVQFEKKLEKISFGTNGKRK